jgi:hypothetical protein
MGDMTVEKTFVNLRDEIMRKHGHVNHVVVCGGGWWEGGMLSSVSLETYQSVLRELTMSQFLVYKTFIGQLSQLEKSTFTFINGGSVESNRFLPTVSIIPISAGTVNGIYTAAASEFKDNQNVTIM